jgi:hypothetical protein
MSLLGVTLTLDPSWRLTPTCAPKFLIMKMRLNNRSRLTWLRSQTYLLSESYFYNMKSTFIIADCIALLDCVAVEPLFELAKVYFDMERSYRDTDAGIARAGVESSGAS